MRFLDARTHSAVRGMTKIKDVSHRERNDNKKGKFYELVMVSMRYNQEDMINIEVKNIILNLLINML